ncbi:MAG: hypothetical protein ACF8PG_03910, partial [Maioricimonas sp. JB045]
PTPAEVGAANDAAWESIAFIDMEYVVSTRLVEQGRVVVERESGLNRWVRTPTHERLLLRDLDGKGLAVDRLVGESVIRLLQYPVDMDFTADPIRPCDDRPVKATISPASPGVLDELVPQNMELLHFTRSAPRMRLSELLRTWKVGEISRTTGPDDDKRLAMTAELRPGGGEGAYSVVKLTVNSSKGYLVERAEMVEADAARAIDSEEGAAIKTVWEVLEWAEVEPGVWYPVRVSFSNLGRADASASTDGYFVEWRATKLTVNTPPAEEWLGFEFPENSIVQEFLADGQPGRILVWGPGNMPQTEFSSEEEYEVYRRALCNDAPTRAAVAGPGEGLRSDEPSSAFATLLTINVVVLFVGGLAWVLIRSRGRRRS